MFILGLSGGFSHDSAACLVKDGAIVAMAEEERFVRIKRAYRLPPVRAALYCLQEGDIDISDVDIIAASWNPELDKETPWITGALKDFLTHEAFRGKKLPPVVYVDHHQSHAASSFYTSGFDEAAILVVDGQGESVSTTIAHGKDCQITTIGTFDAAQSIGGFYDAVSRYVGLGNDSAGKLMGLAPYGIPVYEFDKIRYTADGYFMDVERPVGLPPGLWYTRIRSEWESWLANTFGPPNRVSLRSDTKSGGIKRELSLERRFKDIAASAQRSLEELLLHLVRVAVRVTGNRNLVLSGGVALNCSANGRIRQSGMVDDIYIFPAAHDAGGALGAALEVAAQHRQPRSPRLDHAYWGPAFDDATIADTLQRLGIRAEMTDDIGHKAAAMICQGATIGWFQGRMEVGPRALGHRSILADPTKQNNLEHINRNVKGRETWRPLAPSMIEESAMQVLDGYAASPFMLQAFQVRDEFRSTLPAVTHVDGSTRPQTLNAATTHYYHDLLHNMKMYTGVGAVLNTSFNGENEPIVCTPIDAIRTFYSTGLDAMIIGHFIVRKEGVS
jgi:carbamoyltransferase